MSRRRMVLVHSSDEMYGADRMLLEVVEAARPDLDVEVWLPTDLDHPAAPLCEELARRGVAFRHMALPIVRRAYLNPRGLVGIVRRLGTLARALRRSRPATVYCATSAALLAAPLARVLRIGPVVLHAQEIWSGSDRRILGLLARPCHRIVAISRAVADSLPASLRTRVRVVPNGTPEPDRWSTLRGRTGPLTFLVASRWNGWKGHRTLLAAWDRASGPDGAPGTLVVIGGPPPSGDAVDVPALAAALKYPESVRIVGETTEAARYLDEADVIVMPSDQPEPFGLVAIEAFARGRPVIASAAGGLLDIVTDGSDGWLFPPQDVEALARVLTGLDRDAVAEAGQRARETYEKRFTVGLYAGNWRAAVGEAETCGRGRHQLGGGPRG